MERRGREHVVWRLLLNDSTVDQRSQQQSARVVQCVPSEDGSVLARPAGVWEGCVCSGGDRERLGRLQGSATLPRQH